MDQKNSIKKYSDHFGYNLFVDYIDMSNKPKLRKTNPIFSCDE